MIDPFGLGQEPESADPPLGSKSSSPAANRRKLWAVLLVIDTIIVLIFGGALGSALYFNSNPGKLLSRWRADESVAQNAPKPVRPAPKTMAPPVTSTSAVQAQTAAPAPALPATPPAVSTAPKSGAAAASNPPAAPAPKGAAASNEPKKAKPIEFTCRSKAAQEVFLKGTFLVHSKAGMKRMKWGDDGLWHASVMLLPGSYKYQCVINGKKFPYKTIDVP